MHPVLWCSGGSLVSRAMKLVGSIIAFFGGDCNRDSLFLCPYLSTQCHPTEVLGVLCNLVSHASKPLDPENVKACFLFKSVL